MSKWQEKTKRPVLPVYMAALAWPGHVRPLQSKKNREVPA